MIATRTESPEVLYPEDKIIVINDSDLEELKRLSMLNSRQRVRLCAHSSPNDHLHEMFIVHTKECYVRPHKHLGKAESMAILEGEVDVVIFNEDGTIQQIIGMGEINSGKCFYYRLSEGIYHMLLIRSEFLVFHETTEGPFLRGKTIFPEWAPKEIDPEVKNFINRIELLIAK